MRVAVYFVCAALIFYVKGEDASNFYRRVQPLALTADQETISYLLPKFTARHLPNPHRGDMFPGYRFPDGKKSITGRSGLSIVDSLNVLRETVEAEIQKKKQQEDIERNRQLLRQIGKRATFGYKDLSSDYDNF